MPSTKRIRRAITLLQNLAEESLVTSMLVAHLESARRRDSSYSIEKAVAEVGTDRDAFLQRMRRSTAEGYALELKWIVDAS